jgi:uncharacterized membrane protein YhaH (DUF805 family)
MEKQAERVGLIGAIENFFSCYATFSGKSSRSEYWFLWMAEVLLLLVLLLFPFSVAITVYYFEVIEGWAGPALQWVPILTLVVVLALVVPNLAIMSRRLRDAGISPYFLFFIFLPILGGLALFVMMMFPSKEPSTP